MLAGDFVRPASFEPAFKILSSIPLPVRRTSLPQRATHLTKELLNGEFPDSFSSSFLRIVPFSGLRRPAVLVLAGLGLDWRALEFQLAFWSSRWADCDSGRSIGDAA